jgi:hypothetical protein
MSNSRRMLRASPPDSSAALSNHTVAATQPIHPDPTAGTAGAVALPPDQPQHPRTARADPKSGSDALLAYRGSPVESVPRAGLGDGWDYPPGGN